MNIPGVGYDFGTPDPSLTLGSPPTIHAPEPGPIRPLEFVIELVGPRTAPSTAVDALLTREWQGILGSPRIWVMAPSDAAWRPLIPGQGGSYDSIALTYRLIGELGSLSTQSADALVSLAEKYANQIGRRCMPMPVPADVSGLVQGLLEIREALDIGYGIAVAFGRPPVEEKLWRTLVAFGLNLSPAGEFVWGSADVLSVTPTEHPEQFTLRGVQTGRIIPGISVGFSVPRSPAPEQSLAATLRLANALRTEYQGLLVDENGNPVVPNELDLSRFIKEAKASLERTGIHPGSREALALFQP